MSETECRVHLERAVTLERELQAARKAVGECLRAQREAAGKSLRDVAPTARLTGAALSNIERGISWNTRTITRLVRTYAGLTAA